MRMIINPGRLKDALKVTEIVIDNSGSFAEKVERVVIPETYAEITEMYVKDYMLSMKEGIKSEVKLTMRYDERVNNKSRIYRFRNGKTYKVVNILPDERDMNYMHVFAERVDDV